VPVVIIGAGPTGLTAATLLGQYGVECLVLDRWESIYPQPRAVHLDDEIYRILARIGLREEFAAISRPLEGLRLVDRNMRMLGEFRRGTAEGKHGYPEANMYDQPELEALLRANLTHHPTGHDPGQRRRDRRHRGRRRTGAGRGHRPGDRGGGNRHRGVRARLRRRQQPRAGCHRRIDA
jgi:2-polyprenyl-6-methoxyphenol hydroxylase-like FAD-dependent oxidoreductase